MSKSRMIADATLGAVRRMQVRLAGQGRKILFASVALVTLAMFAQSNRYETSRLSDKTFIVSDRIFAEVLFCAGDKCSPIKVDGPASATPKPSPASRSDTIFEWFSSFISVSSARDTPPHQNTVGVDFSRMTDDEFLETLLGESLEKYHPTYREPEPQPPQSAPVIQDDK